MPPPLTILIPVWNEEGPVRPVVEEILQATPPDFRVLIMNDGSSDATPALIDQLAASHDRVSVLHLPHQGKDHALWAGIRAANTEWLGMTDGDGQYDPLDFQRLMDTALAGNADAVWGVRERRQDTRFRLVISRAGRWFKKAILGSSAVTDSGCGIWVARRRFLLPIANASHAPAGQIHCHLADLMVAQGAAVREMIIHHRARITGTAKYGMFNRLIPGLRSLLQANEVRRSLPKAP